MTSDDAVVTIRTEKATDFSSDVIVVYSQPCLELVFVARAEGTGMVLFQKEFVVLLKSDAILPTEMGRPRDVCLIPQ